jgi:hypothetical protein
MCHVVSQKQTDISEVYTVSIIITPMMEAVHTSETLVYLYNTTKRYIPKAVIFSIISVHTQGKG